MNNDFIVDIPEIPEAYQERWKQDNNSIVFFPLAEAYRKAGKLDQAVQLCQHGLSVHPYYWGARVVLARAYLEQDKLDEAKAELEKVVEIVPYNLLASKLLGQIYTRQGDLSKAVHRYRIISSFYPEVPQLNDLVEYIMKIEVPRKKRLLETLEQWLGVIKKSFADSEEYTK